MTHGNEHGFVIFVGNLKFVADFQFEVGRHFRQGDFDHHLFIPVSVCFVRCKYDNLLLAHRHIQHAFFKAFDKLAFAENELHGLLTGG
ncbi:MAG: hypothetical protein ACD_75C00275G0001 [uncultured bacterium]|nr:MAG: hypothetical protein ACD_75C00275G0001 [uncultured bacterium]